MATDITDRIQGVIASLAIKVRCVVAVEVNVASLSGISNPYSGVFVADGDRVLLTAQADATLNGIWCVSAAGAWTRAADWDGNRDVQRGTTIWAGQQTGDDKLWQVQTNGVIQPGTTAVSITELFNPAAPSTGSLFDVTSVGNDTLGNDIIITSLDPTLTFKDSNNAGGTATGNLIFTDSGDVEIGSVRMLSSDLVLDSVSGDVSVNSAANINFGIGANTAMTISNNIVRVNTDSGGFLEIRDDIGSNTRITSVSDGLNFISAAIVGGDPDRYLFQPVSGGEGMAFMIAERNAARADIAGYGQLFVRDDTPNVLVFRDDAGGEFVLNGSGLPAGTNDGDMLYWDTGGAEYLSGTRLRLDNTDGELSFYTSGNALGGRIRTNVGPDRLVFVDSADVVSMEIYTNLIQTNQDFRVQNGFLEVSNDAGNSRMSFDAQSTADAVTVANSAGGMNRIRMSGVDLGFVGQTVASKPASVANEALIWSCGDGLSQALYNRGENVSAPLDNLHTATWRFNTPTTAADPNNSLFRLNSGTPGSVTQIYIDDNDALSDDADWFLSTIEVGDVLTLRTTASRDKWGLYSVDSVTDNTGWWTIGVTVIDAGATIYANTDHVQFELQKTGSAPGTTDHTALSNIGTNSHAQIDTHIADGTIHFTQGSISITASQVSDFASAVSSNAAVAANTAKVSNATHTGDVTGSVALTIANNAVTNAKAADMAGFTVKAKATTGSGDPADLSVGTNTVVGRVAGNIVAAQVATGQVANNAITLAKLATQAANTALVNATAGTAVPTALTIGTNTVLGRVAGNIVAAQLATGQVADNAITNAKLSDMAANTVKVRTTGSGDPQDLLIGTDRILGHTTASGVLTALDGSQVNVMLPAFTSGLKGLAPASGGGTTNFLRADGTWAAPGGGVTPPIVLLDSEEIRFGTGNDAQLDFDGTNLVLNMTAGNFLFQGAGNMLIRGGRSLSFYDSTNNDFLTIVNNGTDVVVSKTGIGEIFFDDQIHLHIEDGAELRLGNINDVTMLWDNANNEFEVNVLGATSEYELRINGAQAIRSIGGGATSLGYDGVYNIATIEYFGTGNTSGGTILGHNAQAHDIGFNDLRVFNDNVSDTLEASHAGLVAFKDAATARTLTLAASGDLDFPVEAMTTVINAFTSGDYTITEGSGTTLYYLDGSTRTDTAGGCTVGPGGVANIWRESATVYYIWGTGITP